MVAYRRAALAALAFFAWHLALAPSRIWEEAMRRIQRLEDQVADRFNALQTAKTLEAQFIAGEALLSEQARYPDHDEWKVRVDAWAGSVAAELAANDAFMFNSIGFEYRADSYQEESDEARYPFWKKDLAKRLVKLRACTDRAYAAAIRPAPQSLSETTHDR